MELEATVEYIEIEGTVYDPTLVDASVIAAVKGDPGIVWKRDYNPENTYNKNDAVYYLGSSYIALMDVPQNRIPGESVSWGFLAKSGSDGLIASITGATKTKITYDSKGLVTAGDNLSESDIPTLSQSKITNLTTDLAAKVAANVAITGATKTKITYDSKGLVTAGNDLSESDIPTLSQSKVTNLTTDLAAKVAANAAITGATKTKITYDSKGLVTAGDTLSESDIPTLSQSKVTNLTTDLAAKVAANAAITGATKTKITYDSKGLVTAGDTLSESDIPTLSQSKVTNLTTDLAAKCDSNDSRLSDTRTPSDSSVTHTKLSNSLKAISAVSASDIDWSAASIFTKTITTGTTLTFSNLQLNKVITLIISGNYTLALPGYCKRISGSYSGSASNNYIQFHCTNDASGSEQVWYTISQEAV